MRKTIGPSQVSNIKVAVRLRPISQNEIDEGQFEIVQIVDQKVSFKPIPKFNPKLFIFIASYPQRPVRNAWCKR